MTLAHEPIARKENRSALGSLGAALSLLAAVGLIIAAMLLPVLQSSDATTTGYAIRKHEQELADLNAQTYNIQAEIAQLSSMTRIQQEASRLGMVPAPRPQASLSVSAPAPSNTLLPRRYLPAAVSRPAPDRPPRAWLWKVLHTLSLR